MCVLDPVKVVITNYPEGRTEELEAPYYPHDIPKEGSRPVPFSREIYIERSDFEENPQKGFFRLAPGREVRLRYAYFITCVEVIKDGLGNITELRCTYDPDTRGGAAADGRKVKGTIHWVEAANSVPGEVRLYDRRFKVANPDKAAASSGKDFTDFLNPESHLKIFDARLEPAVSDAKPSCHFQFERQGYFFVDPVDSRPNTPVFTRVVTLRDTWAKITEAEEKLAIDQSTQKGVEAANNAPAEKRRRIKRSKSEVRNDIRATNPALAKRYEYYLGEVGLTAEEADILTSDRSVSRLFEDALDVHHDAKVVANWVVNELSPYFENGKADGLPFGGAALGALVALVASRTISGTTGKEVLAIIVREGGDPEAIVTERGLEQITDVSSVEPIVEQVIAANPEKAEEYRSGRTGLAGFFVGQVMRKMGGTADPELVQRLVREKLG